MNLKIKKILWNKIELNAWTEVTNKIAYWIWQRNWERITNKIWNNEYNKLEIK
jgi:hypothetical protein